MTDYTDPGLDEDVRKFIHAARAIMYEFQDGLKHAIEGADSLADSAAPFIYMVIKSVEAKSFELEEPELESVIKHLAGSIAEIAHQLGDPDAEDMKQAVIDITGHAVELFSREDEGQEQPPGDPEEMGEPPGMPEGQEIPPEPEQEAPRGLMYG